MVVVICSHPNLKKTLKYVNVERERTEPPALYVMDFISEEIYTWTQNIQTFSLIIDKPHSQTLTVRNRWKPLTSPTLSSSYP